MRGPLCLLVSSFNVYRLASTLSAADAIICDSASFHDTSVVVGRRHTVHTSVIGLHMSGLDLAVFNDQGVTLRAVLTKYRSALESKVKVLGKLARGIGKETNL